MRNFNQPVMTVLASAAAFAGAKALAPSIAAADQAAISSPQLFQDCAYQATANPDFVIVGDSMGIEPTAVSAHRATADFQLEDQQGGEIGDGTGADRALTCNGSLTVRDTIQLKVGSFTTTVPNASVELTVDNSSMQEYNSPDASASGSFSYLKACKIAKQLRGPRAGVTAKVIETHTYTDTGYASVKTTITPYISPLPCDKLPPTAIVVPVGTVRA